MSRQAAVILLAAYVAVLTLVVAAVSAASSTAERVIGHGQIRYKGAGPELWAMRWRRQRRLTMSLRRTLTARVSRVVWLVDAFQCIHRGEGSWGANTGNGYRGGLQFGSREWQRYGGNFASRADLASPSEQITAAIAYHADAGFSPWPNTARACGLIR